MHRISYPAPAPAPAEIRPNVHIRPYPPDMRPDFTIFPCICPTVYWAGIHCFTNSVICTSLFQRARGNDVMIQQSGGSTIRSDIQHYPKWLKYTWLLHQPLFHLKDCSVLLETSSVSKHRARLNSENAEKLIFLRYNASVIS